MRIRLLRDTLTERSTLGRLFIDGVEECFTLEDPVRAEKIAGITAIPAGSYRVTISPSPHLRYITPLLQGVPGFTGVRIHIGNFPRDTIGCILVGRTKDADFVSKSAAAFKALMEKLVQDRDNLRIEIEDGFPAAPLGPVPLSRGTRLKLNAFRGGARVVSTAAARRASKMRPGKFRTLGS
jgi:Family of unknown function (DUF5675)